MRGIQEKQNRKIKQLAASRRNNNKSVASYFDE
jgi:hypothetical protein